MNVQIGAHRHELRNKSESLSHRLSFSSDATSASDNTQESKKCEPFSFHNQDNPDRKNFGTQFLIYAIDLD